MNENRLKAPSIKVFGKNTNVSLYIKTNIRMG